VRVVEPRELGLRVSVIVGVWRYLVSAAETGLGDLSVCSCFRYLVPESLDWTSNRCFRVYYF
jgi:hypothetical protein